MTGSAVTAPPTNLHYHGQEAFSQLVQEAKAKGARYDAIVPVSGGRDSTYILCLATKHYGMNVLAVNYDNEFRVEHALTNMQRACSHLGVDLRLVRSKRDVCRKGVKSGARSAISFGFHALSGVLCRMCSYGYTSAVRIAAEEYQTPLVLWGASQAEDTIDMQAQATRSFDRARWKRAATLSFHMQRLYMIMQRHEFRVPGNPLLSKRPLVLKNPAIKEVKVFDYLPWDRQVIKDTITREAGWEAPAGSVSTWRYDCALPRPG